MQLKKYIDRYKYVTIGEKKKNSFMNNSQVFLYYIVRYLIPSALSRDPFISLSTSTS